MKNSKHFGHTSIDSPTVLIIFHRQSCPGVTYNCYSKPNNNLLARLYYTRLCSTYCTAPGFGPQPHEHFPQCPPTTDYVVNQTDKRHVTSCVKLHTNKLENSKMPYTTLTIKRITMKLNWGLAPKKYFPTDRRPACCVTEPTFQITNTETVSPTAQPAWTAVSILGT